MNLNLSDLPPPLRRAVIIAGICVALVAVASFAMSFGAQRALALERGTWGPILATGLPIIVDLGLIMAELGLVVCSATGYSRFVPTLLMALFFSASLGFNLAHAPLNWVSQLVAAAPPIGTILVSVTAATIVKAVAKVLGKSLVVANAGPAPMANLLGGIPHATLLRTDQPYGQNLPNPALMAQLLAAYTQGQLPHPPGNAQQHLPENGQPGTTGHTAAKPPYGWARQAVQDYLDALMAAGKLDKSVTVRSVSDATNVSEKTVGPILAEYKAEAARQAGNGTKS